MANDVNLFALEARKFQQNKIHIEDRKVVNDLENILLYRTVNQEFGNFYKHRLPSHAPIVTGYNYLFVTTPELNLESQIESAKKNRRILNTSHMYSDPLVLSLTKGSTSNFIRILTNRAVKYTASNITMHTYDYAETWNGYKIVLGKSTQDSQMSGEFTIEYTEDENLNVIKMHKLWMEYIEQAFKGKVVSSQMDPTTGSNGSTRGNKVLEVLSKNMGALEIDYMSSIYHFAVKPDGETIYYWAKYTGIFPSSLPYDMFSSDDGSVDITKSVPIQYTFTHKEDMNPYILSDFNKVANGIDLNSPLGAYWEDNEFILHTSMTLGEVGVVRAKRNISVDNLSTDHDNAPVYKLFIRDQSLPAETITP